MQLLSSECLSYLPCPLLFQILQMRQAISASEA